MGVRTILIKPASGFCNMQCDYCFYCDESEKRNVRYYGMMSEETIRNLIKKALFQAEEGICFAFQGGEPTLRGLDFFRKVIEYEQRFNRNHVQIQNTLQTNGLELDEEWCRFFKENQFLIGVSVDGTEVLHDTYRHDKAGQPTYFRIKHNIEQLESYGVEYNILTVVTRQAAENIRDIYREYKRNGWKYQQYIACLDPFGEKPGQREYSLTPEVYGKFMVELFRDWKKDWNRGKAPYIRQFENYIGILLGYPPESCEQSGICSVQCVAEADGGAYPCDFYVMDAYCLGNYNENKISEFFENPVAREFVQESRKHSQTCRECKWYVLCRNGCRRHRIPDGTNGTYRNYFCESYQMFFETCYEDMTAIAEFIRYQNQH